MSFYDLINRIWNNKQNWVSWVSASECLVCFLIDVCSGVKMRVLHIEPAIALGSIQFDCLWLHSFDDIIYIFCVSFHFCLVCLFTSCCRCCCFSSCCCCCCCWQKEASRSDVTCTATRAPLSASGNGNGIASDSCRTVTSDNVTSTRRGQHDEPTSTSVAAPSPSPPPTPTLTAIATATATWSPISTWRVDQAEILDRVAAGAANARFCLESQNGIRLQVKHIFVTPMCMLHVAGPRAEPSSPRAMAINKLTLMRCANTTANWSNSFRIILLRSNSQREITSRQQVNETYRELKQIEGSMAETVCMVDTIALQALEVFKMRQEEA